MAEPTPPKAVRVAPRPLIGVFLLVFVVLDAALWILGFYHLFLTYNAGSKTPGHFDASHLEPAGTLLTWALVVMLLGGWLWRWLVAQGLIGGRPTPRFGGTAKD